MEALSDRVLLWTAPDGAAHAAYCARTPSGQRVERCALSPPEARALRALSRGGSRAQIAGEARVSLSQLDEVVASWERRCPRAVTRGAREPSAAAARAHAALRLMRTWRSAHELEDEADARPHYVDDRCSARRRFEVMETTVSHAYRVPHPALGGRRYGAALASALLQRGALEPDARVLEIGGGTGRVARALLDELGKRWRGTYELLEISPSLRRAQRRVLRGYPRVRHREGDALKVALGQERFGLVLVNEVIADLPVRVWERARPSASAAELVARFELPMDDAPRRALLNEGALRLVERLGDALAPGGIAVIIEYGSVQDFPHRVGLAEHDEYAIHFGHLVAGARAVGLMPELVPLSELLGFAGETLTKRSSWLLREVAPKCAGRVIPALAHTRDMLAHRLRGTDVEFDNVHTAAVGSGHTFMDPQPFFAAILRKPRRTA